MIAIIDYGMGNLRSVEKALTAVGAEAVITSDADVIRSADKVILPGVGAFGDCMKNLKEYGLIPVIHETVASGKPFLGICLGLQLLFESSEESPGVEGLGIFKGAVRSIPPCGLKVPHMGWFPRCAGRCFYRYRTDGIRYDADGGSREGQCAGGTIPPRKIEPYRTGNVEKLCKLE